MEEKSALIWTTPDGKRRHRVLHTAASRKEGLGSLKAIRVERRGFIGVSHLYDESLQALTL